MKTSIREVKNSNLTLIIMISKIVKHRIHYFSTYILTFVLVLFSGGSRPGILVWLKNNTLTNFIVEKKNFSCLQIS
jgi:hypothetical protein